MILTSLKNVSKRTWALLSIATAIVAVPAGLLAWGPERPTYTLDHPADHVTFNSITNNPNVGDERNFVGIRENGTTGLWQDSQNVTAGKEYVVRMYVHNNAAANLNLVARDVTAAFNLPTDTAKSIEVQGFLRSSNAQPTTVYDHATFKSDKDFNLAVVPGSIKYYNNANGNGFSIPETVFTDAGAKLGYDKMDGNIPGCFQYSGYLTFVVKPQFAVETTDFTMKKQVRLKDATGWNKDVTATPGATVTYRLDFENKGQRAANVVMKDMLPANVSLVAGSVKLYNMNYPGGSFLEGGDALVKNGVNVGSYTGNGSNAIVMFDAKIANADKLACGVNTLRNVASSAPEGQTPKEDSATVTITKKCDEPKPVEMCKVPGKEHLPADSKDCKEEPKPVEKCKVSGKEHLPADSKDCKEEPKPVMVEACNIDKKKIESVEESKIDDVHYTKDLAKCAEQPKPVDMCKVPGKEYLPADSKDCKEEPKPIEMCKVPGKENLPADSKDCKEDVVVTPETPAAPTPEPETPAELPHTGVTDGIVGILGFGTLVGVASAYIASRRSL